MFDLFPKFGSAGDSITPEELGWKTWKTDTQIPNYVQAQDEKIGELLKENNKLKDENKNLEDILKSIEEDGTTEHNNAINLRESVAHLREEAFKKLNEQADIISELTKEVIGLRHLKKENVELIEKLEKEGKSYGMTFNEAKTQIIQNDYKKCAEERDEYKHQLNAANKEIEALKNDKKYWKEQYLEFSDNDFNDIKKENEILKKEAEDSKKCTVGWRESYDKVVTEKDELLKKYRELRVIAENLESKLRNTQDEMCYKFSYTDMDKLQKKIDVLQKERDILKRWKYEQLIVNKLWDKVDDYMRNHDDAPLGIFVANTCLDFLRERDELKHQLNAAKKSLVRWEKWEEVCDYINNHDELKTHGFIVHKQCLRFLKERDELKAEVEKLKKDETQKHPMYPLHWGGYDKNIIDFVESEFSNEDPVEGKQVEFNSEELLKRVTEYADSLDSLSHSLMNFRKKYLGNKQHLI